MTHSRGFTLVEVLVYIGLFAILIGGTTTAVFSLFEGGERNQTAVMVQEEGAFILGKITWALRGTKSVTLLDPTSLSVVKYTETGTTNIVIALSGTDILLQQDAEPAEVLNNANVTVTNLLFSRTTDTGSGIQPESMSASFSLTARTANGSDLTRTFTTTAYERQ